MKQLIITTCLALLSLSMLAHAAKDEQKSVPTFRPGASVELLLAVDCPKGWAHNPMMPLKLSFDEEYLKTAPFTVKENSFSVKFEGHPASKQISIPVKLKSQLPDGELNIPATIDAFICTADESMCIMASEAASLRIKVQSKPAKGSKDQALDKGQLELSHRLAPPEE